MTQPGTPTSLTPTTEDKVAELRDRQQIGDVMLRFGVQAVAPAAEGGLIDRCSHRAAEERPDFVAALAAELAGPADRAS